MQIIIELSKEYSFKIDQNNPKTMIMSNNNSMPIIVQ